MHQLYHGNMKSWIDSSLISYFPTEKHYGVLFSHSKKGEEYHYAAISVSLYDKVYMEVRLCFGVWPQSSLWLVHSLQNFKHFIQEEYEAVQFNHHRRMVHFKNDIAQVETPNIDGWDIIASSEPCSVSCRIHSCMIELVLLLLCLSSVQTWRSRCTWMEWRNCSVKGVLPSSIYIHTDSCWWSYLMHMSITTHWNDWWRSEVFFCTTLC